MTTAMAATTTQVDQVFIRATPEAIWEAITRPEFTERYFYGVRMDVMPQRRHVVVHDRLEGAPKTAAQVAGVGGMFVLSNLKTFLETGEPL